MYSAFQNAPSASVWQKQHLHVHQARVVGCWVTPGQVKGPWKTAFTEKGDAASQIIILPAPYISHPPSRPCPAPPELDK